MSETVYLSGLHIPHRTEMPQAARLLAFLAYSDHQDIWYDLLWVGSGTDRPQWFADLIRDEFFIRTGHYDAGEVGPG